MQKINFENLPSTNTPINATNLNQMQTNTEDAINGIIESNNNSNGTYIKYADGTLIQRGKYTTPSIEATAGYRQSVNLPINFIDTDYNVLTQKMSGGSGGFSEVIESVYVRDNSMFDVTSWNNRGGAAEPLIIGWVAIGKWK